MSCFFKIAIDGPAGSGKSTIAKIIADKKHLIYVDSGAMYRAVTFNCLINKIDIDNPNEIISVCLSTKISFLKKNGKLNTLIDDKDVSDEIRSREVTNNVFKIAREPKVREHLVKQQREFAEKNSVIMDGRDIGTVVYPDADLKIYLDASVEERTKRRFEELRLKGEKVDFEKLKQEVIDRDYQDISRKTGPLKIAEDAVVIDTTDLTIEKVCDTIIELINNIEKS